MTRAEHIVLTRTYEKEVKRLKLCTRFAGHPKNRKRVRAAVKRLKIISGRLLREIQCKMILEQLHVYSERFALYLRMLLQKRGGKNKLYSLHESPVYYMRKGKTHKRFEFGTKASVTTTRDSGIIICAQADKNILMDIPRLLFWHKLNI